MTTDNNIQAAIAAGIALGEPRIVGPGLSVVVVPDGGRLVEVDTNAHEDKYSAHPRRKTGTVHVQDAPSFVDYITKHGLSATEVWADTARHQLVGVINAHEESDGQLVPGDAGHGDHRVVLELTATPAWKAWTGRDKQWMGQAEFAEHIEDNVLDVVTPDGATMLEIAQSFHATTGVTFKSATRLHSGEAQLMYEENTGASAGHKGDLEIPTRFSLAVQPYCGQGELAGIEARFRYRIRSGELLLSYALSQPDVILRNLFDEIVNTVRDGVGEDRVFHGRPS